MIILASVDHGQFALDFRGTSETVVFFAETESRAVEIGGEICYCCCDTRVKGTAVGEVTAETHSCATNTAIAGGEGEEVIDC